MKISLVKLPIAFLLIVVSLFCKAQQTEGIIFEKNMSWSQIKEKAKRENKYIFLDAYTTWCIPCKQMTQDIFPLKEVGDFFNQNFINVAVQFDVTKNDHKEVKKWYGEAKLIKDLYGVEVYPTYLFFSPDGSLVHVIKGAIFKSDEFIAKSKEALTPAKQFLSLKKAYDMGKRSDDFLLNLIKSADKAGDYQYLPEYVNTYLTGQKTLLTAQNFQIAALGASKYNGIAFNMLLNNPNEAILALGEHQRIKILSQVIFDNEIFPLLRINGKVKNKGFVISYSGEINRSVNWEGIQDNLKTKYGALSSFVYTNSRLIYFMWLKDWKSFNETMKDYVTIKEDLNLAYVSDMASYLIAVSDQESAIVALEWAKVLLKNNNIPYYKKDYSRLLYKAGKKVEAVTLMQDYINTKGVNDKSAVENIEKMKKGEEFYW